MVLIPKICCLGHATDYANMKLEIILRNPQMRYWKRCVIPLSNAIADVVAIACLRASLTTGLLILNEARRNERCAQTDG